MTARGALPRLAVLLCTHNGEVFIGEQLDSLIAQELPPARVFIHDWASADATLAVIESRRHLWPAGCEVEVVRHENAPGACRSFLGALDEVLAAGSAFDYLLFCDQDDVWHPSKLATFARRAAMDPALDLIYCDISTIDARGSELEPSYYGRGAPLRRPIDVSNPAVLFVGAIGGMSLAVSRRLLDRARAAWALDDWFMHDWAVAIIAHVLGAPAAFIPEVLVRYRQHGANAVGAVRPPGIGSPATIVRRARDYVGAVRRQYAACAGLRGCLPGMRPLDPTIGALAVVWTVLRGSPFGRLRTARAALGYLIFWRSSARDT